MIALADLRKGWDAIAVSFASLCVKAGMWMNFRVSFTRAMYLSRSTFTMGRKKFSPDIKLWIEFITARTFIMVSGGTFFLSRARPMERAMSAVNSGMMESMFPSERVLPK